MGRERPLDYPALDEGRAPAHVAILTALVAGAAAVRLLVVGEPLRYDETFSFLEYASKPVSFIVSHYEFPNNHVLNSLGVHFTWRAFGDHVWVIRAPSLLAGVALIPAVYLAGRALYDRRAGLWGAALAATFAPLVDYSVNGRGYMPGALFTVLALWLAAVLLDRPRRLRAWAGFVVCAALAVYSVPSYAYAISTVALWMGLVALLRRDLATVARLVGGFAVTALVSLLLYSGMLGEQGWSYAPPLGLSSGASVVRDLYVDVWDNWNRAAPHPLDWLVAAGFVVSLVLHRRIARHPVPLVVPAAAVVVGIFAIERAGPYTRLWLYLLPLYLLCAGAGLSHAVERAAARLPRPEVVRGAALALVALALGVAVVREGVGQADQNPISEHGIAEYLQRELRPGQAALLDPASVGYTSQFYFLRAGYRPPGLPPRRAPLTALVVVLRGGGAREVRRIVAETGWRVPPAGRPRLDRRFEYVEAWRTPLR